MDELLGLPQGYRISKRPVAKTGLLESLSFAELTKSILEKEENEGGNGGKGGIKALRKHIAGIKQLLRESICP